MSIDKEVFPQMPRIVVVDDDPISLNLINGVLEREYPEGKILTFHNAQQAMSILKRGTFNLIVLDLWMPELTGFDMLAQLRTMPSMQHVPVVVLTASDEVEDLNKAFALGANDYIQKPILPHAFAARIAAQLKTQSLQQALQEKNQQLDELNHLKNELLSICSHDLRSPLSAIDLLCQFLQAPECDENTQKSSQLGKRILYQSRIARHLVESLLDLNRIEDGEFTASPSFFNPIELLQQCLESENAFVEAQKLKPIFTHEPIALLCFGDRQLIWQLVRNLLSNAIKFASTTINLSCQVEAMDAKGGNLVMKVYNDGQQIMPAMQQRVFDKHVKGEHKRAGRGMGLYIAHRIVKLHWGKIWVDTSTPEGTSIQVVLPNAFYPSQLPDLSDFSRAKVWIASSSKRTAQLLESVLTESGLLDIRIIDSLNGLPQASSENSRDALGNSLKETTGKHQPGLQSSLIVDLETLSPPPLLNQPLYAPMLPVITYGSGKGMKAEHNLAKWPHLDSPLNPLQLLTKIRTQLQHTLSHTQP